MKTSPSAWWRLNGVRHPRRERKSLLEAARTRPGPARGADGFSPVRIGRIGRIAAGRETFAPGSEPETAVLSDFVAAERAAADVEHAWGRGTLPIQ